MSLALPLSLSLAILCVSTMHSTVFVLVLGQDEERERFFNSCYSVGRSPGQDKVIQKGRTKVDNEINLKPLKITFAFTCPVLLRAAAASKAFYVSHTSDHDTVRRTRSE